MMGFSRRNFLQILGVTGGVVALRQATRGIPLAHADAPKSQNFVLAYMGGGWDQLMVLDPRDNTKAQYQEEAARKPGGTGIQPAYDLITDPAVKTLLAANPSGVQRAGALTFGPAVPQSLMDHAVDLSIVRGVSMDTLTHEVARRYFLTGKFPRGLAANGSSITAHVANAAGPSALLPNLAVSMESYAEGLPAYASATSIGGAEDLQSVLKPLGKSLDPGSLRALEAYRAAARSCEGHELDAQGAASTFEAMNLKAQNLATSGVASLFEFNLNSPSKDVRALFDALGIATTAGLAGPRGRAAIAAQALARGVSNAVSLQLSTGLDDHTDWDTDHAPNLRTGLDALGRLIAYLKSAPHASGGSVWSNTTLLLCSEFSRTPMLNVRGGRDHHLAGSALVAGPKIRGGQVIGATSEQQMATQNIDLKTGKVSASGAKVRPADVHGTLLTSMGLDTAPLANQNPQIIDALLKP
jgi:uncharacterized protein (DUF1501 family)